jgi:hypothetical protein
LASIFSLTRNDFCPESVVRNFYPLKNDFPRSHSRGGETWSELFTSVATYSTGMLIAVKGQIKEDRAFAMQLQGIPTEEFYEN